MQLPMQITWRDTEPSLAVETKIREEAAKLEEFYNRVSSCRVMIEIPHQHQYHGNPFHIRIDLTTPGGEIVVNREPTLHGSLQRIGGARANIARQQWVINLRCMVNSIFGVEISTPINQRSI